MDQVEEREKEMLMCDACATRDCKKIAKLVEEGYDINKSFSRITPRFGGCTLLGVACYFCACSVVALLLKLGADKDAVDIYGYAPLHYAIQPDIDNSPEPSDLSINIVDQLLTAGADPTKRNHGWIKKSALERALDKKEPVRTQLMACFASHGYGIASNK